VSAYPLTAREIEVIELLCEGLLYKQIAAKLGISPRTVETHVAHSKRKLGFRAHGAAQIVRWWVTQQPSVAEGARDPSPLRL
jgi:DNA-binding CsgD family transcriptional regulator